MLLVGCTIGESDNQQIIIIGVNDFDENLFVHGMGRHYLSAGAYVDVSINWNGDGRVIFLSSTSGLSENNIIELIEDGLFTDITEADGLVTVGAIRVINDTETMLEFAYSCREINWRINFHDTDGDITSYGYRYFYIITNAGSNVSNISGEIKFSTV